eukprot:scaffold96023_cov50-Attheya_sp.AAC.1
MTRTCKFGRSRTVRRRIYMFLQKRFTTEQDRRTFRAPWPRDASIGRLPGTSTSLSRGGYVPVTQFLPPLPEHTRILY